MDRMTSQDGIPLRMRWLVPVFHFPFGFHSFRYMMSISIAGMDGKCTTPSFEALTGNALRHLLRHLRIKIEGKTPIIQQEKLLALKCLVKKQLEQLAEKDVIIEKQNSQLEKQRIQIENIIQALLHARKKLFGPSTQATKQIEGQLFLFEKAQRLAEELGIEQKKITVTPYTRSPGRDACWPAKGD